MLNTNAFMNIVEDMGRYSELQNLDAPGVFWCFILDYFLPHQRSSSERRVRVLGIVRPFIPAVSISAFYICG